MGLSSRSKATVLGLLWFALDDIIDDPCYPDEVREQWADYEALAEEVGIDIVVTAREARPHGTALERFGEIVGVDFS